MTDDLKFLVNEINKILKTDYNLISFDSMSADGLLQVLVDVLVFHEAAAKFDVKFINRDETVRRILESLKKIQYRPEIDAADPGAFPRNIAQGDKRTIYPILRYIFENAGKIRHLTYLAQFLLPISLPPEALANPEIAILWNDYIGIMEEFKEAHKAHTEATVENAKLKELRNDINAIDVEKENVKKRLERTQSRLDKIPQQDLILESAHVLRLERERQKELLSHVEDQKHGIHRAKIMQERLQKELSNARMTTQSTSAHQLMETILEETQVMDFMVKQKLPQEIHNIQQEIKLLEDVIDEPNVSRDYLSDLQNKVDVVAKEVQNLVERKLSERNTQNDSLLPFRQQAAIVAKNKEMAAEQMNQATKELREINSILKQKQDILQETVGEVILRGEELKQYVNTLRAKSSVYKQQRAELAAVKAEVSDLTQTLENLKTQDPTLSTTLENMDDDEISLIDTNFSRPESPMEARGLTELSRVVEGLNRAVNSVRERVTPLLQKVRPLRERVLELKDDRESKKQTYESVSATLNAEASVLQGEIAESERLIKNLENDWQHLKSEYDRAENLLERVQEDDSNKSAGSISVKETLQIQIRDEEHLFENLQAEKESLFHNQEYRAKQLASWEVVKQLLEVKLACLQEAKARGPGGTLSIEKNSETFILQ